MKRAKHSQATVEHLMNELRCNSIDILENVQSKSIYFSASLHLHVHLYTSI